MSHIIILILEVDFFISDIKGLLFGNKFKNENLLSFSNGLLNYLKSVFLSNSELI